MVGWLKAHLGRRLMGELIAYQTLRRPSVNIFKHLSSETTEQIKLKISYGDLLGRGTKICSNGPCHMTKMAATPIYG